MPKNIPFTLLSSPVQAIPFLWCFAKEPLGCTAHSRYITYCWPLLFILVFTASFSQCRLSTILTCKRTGLISPVICKKPWLLCFHPVKKRLKEASLHHVGNFIPGVAVLTHIEGRINRIQNKWPGMLHSHLFENFKIGSVIFVPYDADILILN